MGGLPGEQKLKVVTEIEGPKSDQDLKDFAQELAALMQKFQGKITSVTKEPK